MIPTNIKKIIITGLILLIVVSISLETKAATCGFGIEIGGGLCRGYLTSTTTTSFSVPSDWNSSSNTIEVIGAGGMGGDGDGASGGGGGAYSKISNQTLSGTVTYQVGWGGQDDASSDSNGGDTWFCNSTSNCASLAGSAVVVGAQGGFAGETGSGVGGAASSGVGTTKNSGGHGGAGQYFSRGGGGGGGAGGPNGNGANGGDGYPGTVGGGGGGGGANNGSAGSNSGGGSGGNGGNNRNSTGGGTGGPAFSGSGSDGTDGGGGGGGGFAASYGYMGGTDPVWATGYGPGGGGGGGSSQYGKGGIGGGYGGGGGGNGLNSGNYSKKGGDGIIVITYASTALARISLLKPPNNLGLIGYWSFDDGTSTLAHDFSGNTNNGTLTNGPTWINGKRSRALDFDGTNDYVVAQHSTTLDIPTGGSVTMCAWVFLRSLPSDTSIMAKRDDTLGTPYAYGINSHAGSLQVYTSGSSGVQAFSYTLPLNIWKHVCGVISSSPTKLYIDGSLFDSLGSGGGVASNSAPLLIGATQYSSVNIQEFLPGKIDEVRVYNRALSATEVASLYKTGAARIGGNETTRLTEGLIGYWPFNGKDVNWTSGSAGVAYDRSGGNNTGTITNMSQTGSVVGGKLGQALNFDGVDDVVSITDTSTIRSTNVKTFSLWINQTGTNNTARILSETFDSNNAWDVTGPDSGNNAVRVSFKVAGSSSSFVSPDGSVPQSGWVHIAGTFDGSAVTGIYINGVAQSLNSPFSVTYGATTGFTIGDRTNGSKNFKGYIDDVRLYDRILSASEIKQLYLLGNVKIKI